MAALKVEGAKFAITVDAQRRIVEDASVLIEGQRITHVATSAELRRTPADRTIDASGCLLTPAFVNAHMHISYAHAVRGIFPDDLVGRARLREV